MIAELKARAARLDAEDKLAGFRELFHVPEGVIYLDGNSLGLLPKSVPVRLAQVAQREWGEGLIRSWNDAGWFVAPMTVGDRIAALIGAGAGEVAVGDSTSVNLFKCLAAALHLNPERKVILAEGKNFPTDGYMAQGLAELVPGVSIRWIEPGRSVADAVGPDVAVVMLSHVDYRTARIEDMAATTAAAQAAGALILWDLSHSTGAVPVDLKGANADFAVGCSYKYLNGGPGAPAFAWAHPRHLGRLKQPLAGWIGHADPFAFSRGYEPAPGARRLVCGTPQVLSLSALDEALKLWAEVDMSALRAKSTAMTSLFIDATEGLGRGLGLELISPREAEVRGSHVSFDVSEGGFETVQALIAEGIIGDFRGPRTMRFGFAPLYLSFAQVLTAAERMVDILASRAWDDPRFRRRGAVT